MLHGDPASTCPLCEEQFNADRLPHSMPCGHTSCRSCLTRIAEPARCPFCREVFSRSQVRKVFVDFKSKPTSSSTVPSIGRSGSSALSHRSSSKELDRERIEETARRLENKLARAIRANIPAELFLVNKEIQEWLLKEDPAGHSHTVLRALSFLTYHLLSNQVKHFETDQVAKAIESSLSLGLAEAEENYKREKRKLELKELECQDLRAELQRYKEEFKRTRDRSDSIGSLPPLSTTPGGGPPPIAFDKRPESPGDFKGPSSFEKRSHMPSSSPLADRSGSYDKLPSTTLSFTTRRPSVSSMSSDRRDRHSPSLDRMPSTSFEKRSHTPGSDKPGTPIEKLQLGHPIVESQQPRSQASRDNLRLLHNPSPSATIPESFEEQQSSNATVVPIPVPSSTHPPGSPLPTTLSIEGGQLTHQTARDFIKYYCQRFGFGDPEILFEADAKTAQWWQAIMRIRGRRIGIGSGPTKQIAENTCWIDAASYVESCLPALWKSFEQDTMARASGADNEADEEEKSVVRAEEPPWAFPTTSQLEEQIRRLGDDLERIRAHVSKHGVPSS